MVMKNWSDERVTKYDLNNNFSEAFIQLGLNDIREMVTGSTSRSKGGIDAFGDAYTDATGRQDSVIAGSTTAFFDTNVYRHVIGSLTGTSESHSVGSTSLSTTTNIVAMITLKNMGIISNMRASLTGTGSLVASVKSADGTIVYCSGITKSASSGVTVPFTPGSYTAGGGIYRMLPPGSYLLDWTSIGTNINMISSGSLGTGAIYSGTYFNLSGAYYPARYTTTYIVSGLDFAVGSSGIGTGNIYHSIPAGTFNGSISSAIFVPFINTIGSGDNITYRLLNGSGDDTGFIACGSTPSIGSFAKFSAEPTALIIQLSSGSAAGSPAIVGGWVRAE